MARMTTLTPSFLVGFDLDFFQGGQAADQSHAAAGNDAFFNGRAGGVEGVFDAGFLLFHFGFGGCADVDDGHAADQLGQTLLQLFTIVVGGGLFDLGADLLDPAFQGGAGTGAVDDGGVVFVDADALGFAQVLQGSGFPA
jgi:hypothetical protein